MVYLSPQPPTFNEDAKKVLQETTIKAPIEITKKLGISVYHRNDLEELLGFYTIVNGIRVLGYDLNIPMDIKKNFFYDMK